MSDRTEATCPARAWLHLPEQALAGCIYMGAERDTRGAGLDAAQRFNYYPASPLPMLSWIFEGELHMVQDEAPTGAADADRPARLGPALPRVTLAGPHRRPTASWAPGAVHGLSVAFYPHAWKQLLGLSVEDCRDQILPLDALPASALRERLMALADESHAAGSFAALQSVLQPHWRELQDGQMLPSLRNWMHALGQRALWSAPMVGLRQMQRRMRSLSGQSQRELQLYARVEEVFERVVTGPADQPLDLADLAAAAGYADQSHLGREVRRVTGLPPGRLQALMRSEEPFWIYRLMERHLQRGAG